MNLLEVAVRFLHLAVVMLLVGSFSFHLLVRRPAFRRAERDLSPYFQSAFKSQFRLARWSLLIAVCTAVVGLIMKVATVTGVSWSESANLKAASSVLFGTQFGKIWILRMVLACFLAIALAVEQYRWMRSDSTALHLMGGVLTALLLTTLAGTGHAAAAEGVTLLTQVSMDALHLLAAGAWLGGLVSFATLFAWARRHRHRSTVPMMQEATARFSRLGVVSVSTLVITGLFNTWYFVGGIPPLLGTTYGQLLLIKLALLIPLLAFASRNLLYLKPRLSAVMVPEREEQATSLLAQLKRSVIGEVTFGATILVIVAMMGITPPARHVQPEWPFSFRLDWNAIKASPQAGSQVTYGSALSLLGVALFGFALPRPRHRRWLSAVAALATVSGGLIVATSISIDAYPTTYRRPAIAYQTISIANGMTLYHESCAMCHGKAGYGDGPAAAELNPKPADLTARHATDHTAGDLYWWLSHGVRGSAMPGFKESLTEDERWDVINFLRALSSSEKARSLAPIVETEARLVAPDFLYATNRGETKALKDNRGSKIVLLVLFFLPDSRDRLLELDRNVAKLTTADLEILVVPSDVKQAQEDVESRIGNLPLITDGSDEIFKTYSLFGHSLDMDRNSPEAFAPRHTEFLIDKSGYIRARWIAGEGTGWLKLENLLQQIEMLLQEKSRAPAPDDHVH
jgi:putative copper export protein/mono/diheme cytochrome c family protein/peroxiredoxin